VERSEADIERSFREETARLTAARLPLGTVAVAAVFAFAWILEHGAHPERDWVYAVVYVGELLTLGVALALTRRPRWGAARLTVAAVALAAIPPWIGAYHIWTQGEGEVLVMALLYLTTGTMVLFPWGWQGQLPVVLSAMLTYTVAVQMGVRTASPLAMNFLGLATISTLSVGGAVFLARHRRRFLRQASRLRLANTALAAASQAKNQFLAGVSHELRTPLNIIVGYADLLAEGHFGALPAEAQEAVARVARSSRSLGYLINDLLDLARMEAGRLLVHLHPVELAPVFAEMAQFVEPRLNREQVAFHWEAPASLRVIADRERLVQVLVNLLSNALKFTARGEIHLRVQAPEDSVVAIEVRDTGVGIDASELHTLFEPFHQGASGRKLGGVGIGLSVSARLAEAMGGQLSASSEPGCGARFVLRLPAAPGEEVSQ